MLSQSCMYGVRAALLVTTKSGKNDGKYIPIRQISDELDVSFHFLTKILQVLTHAGIMESYKGPNGGIRLARAARAIHLMDIVTALDGDQVFKGCVLGLPGCHDDRPCSLHEGCSKAMGRIQGLFEKTTLAKLARDTDAHTLRL